MANARVRCGESAVSPPRLRRGRSNNGFRNLVVNQVAVAEVPDLSSVVQLDEQRAPGDPVAFGNVHGAHGPVVR